MPCIKAEVESFLTLGACASITVVVPCVCYQATGSCSFASPNCSVTEDIIRFSKMGGHDGQPIPKLIGHLLHLLGHATEFKSLAISACTCTTGSTRLVGCTREAANKVN